MVVFYAGVQITSGCLKIATNFRRYFLLHPGCMHMDGQDNLRTEFWEAM